MCMHLHVHVCAGVHECDLGAISWLAYIFLLHMESLTSLELTRRLAGQQALEICPSLPPLC